MATITKRLTADEKTYYTAQVRLKGYKPQTASFKRLTDAKKWVQDTESAIREGRHFKTAEAKKHTVSEMITRYCSEYMPNNKQKTYSLKEQNERTSRLSWWSEKIGHFLLADITSMAITEQINTMTQKPATIDKYVKNLSHVFTITVNDWGWINENPVRKVTNIQLPPGRVRYLDTEERGQLMLAAKESPNSLLYLCVILALATGMRRSELMELKWSDVNLEDGYIILQKTKNGSRRRVPLSGYGLSLLQDHAKIKQADTPFLFPSRRVEQQPIDLRKAFANALKAANITDFKWHDFRHCTGSYLAMNSASLFEIMEVLGQKSPQMAKRYSHLSPEHVSNVTASMNAKMFEDM